MSLGETVVGEAGLAVLSAWGQRAGPLPLPVLHGASCGEAEGPAGRRLGTRRGRSQSGQLLGQSTALAGPQRYRIGEGVAGELRTGRPRGHRPGLGPQSELGGC